MATVSPAAIETLIPSTDGEAAVASCTTLPQGERPTAIHFVRSFNAQNFLIGWCGSPCALRALERRTQHAPALGMSPATPQNRSGRPVILVPEIVCRLNTVCSAARAGFSCCKPIAAERGELYGREHQHQRRNTVVASRLPALLKQHRPRSSSSNWVATTD